MKCLILGAGQGNRLKPLTEFIPKYMLPFGDKSIVDNGIETLVSLGLDPIFVKRKNQPGPNIETVEVARSERGDLIESVYRAKDCIDEDDFCWTGGEILSQGLDFRKALEEHKKRGAYATFFHVPDLRFTPKGNLEGDRIVEFATTKERFDYSFIPFVITNRNAFPGMEKYGYQFIEAAISKGELILAFPFSGRLWNIDTSREYFNASRDLLREYIDPASQVKDSNLRGSFVYNSLVKNSNVRDSIIINAKISYQQINRKLIYGGKNGCQLDIPN